MDAFDAAGFWSYARRDDESETGKIVDLAKTIQNEYAIQTGNSLVLFVDRELEWGDQWRDRIEDALTGVTFFIPIITPTYFLREECRRELLAFHARATEAGVPELLLPILYTHVADLNPDSADLAKQIVGRTQYEDWRELRLEDVGSSPHRRGVARLAEKLARITAEVESRPPVEPELALEVAQRALGGTPSGEREKEEGEATEDEEPGLFDILAASEEELDTLGTTLGRLTPEMEQINDLFEQAAVDVERADASGQGFKGRLAASHKLATGLAGPAEAVRSIGRDYLRSLSIVDPGVRALIDLGRETKDPDDRAQMEELFQSIRGLGETSAEGTQTVETLIEGAQDISRFSRELRRPLGVLREGLRDISDGHALIASWVDRLDEPDDLIS